MIRNGIDLAERGILPDPIVRWGIRRLLRSRIRQERQKGTSTLTSLINQLEDDPLAHHVRAANRQHYELPPQFFSAILGRHLKYSCCYWPSGTQDLDEAEEAMLELSCHRAQIEDGMQVLELGCGWGSLALWMAQRYPASRIISMSNSHSQREFILDCARRRGVENLEVETADINHFETQRRFDRVVSIEMFEHVRNYPALFARIGRWLESGGKLFVHVFCHKDLTYPFETEGADIWMGRHFFTGGLMPSETLLTRVQKELALQQMWRLSGRHYQKTARAWLRNMSRRKPEILALFNRTYPPEQVCLWWNRWRIFFLSCQELFGFRGGQEWQVCHYLFGRAGTGVVV